MVQSQENSMQDSHPYVLRALSNKCVRFLILHVYIYECAYIKRDRVAQHRVPAGLSVVVSRLGGGNRWMKVRIMAMEWWHKVVFPVRRVWCAVAVRVKPRKNGGGLVKLPDDIQTCGYEDVQKMWEMLRRTESQVIKRKNGGWFWRNFA